MEKSEYEIQHFNFSVEQFSLERRHYLNKILSLTLQSMVEKLSINDGETKELLAEKKESIKRKILDDMEKHLIDLEKMDNENFCIPDYVLLATDNSLSKQYSEVDEKEADEAIDNSNKLFLENAIMIESLKVENEKYKEIRGEIEKEEKIGNQVQQAIQTVYAQWELAKNLIEETKSLEF